MSGVESLDPPHEDNYDAAAELAMLHDEIRDNLAVDPASDPTILRTTAVIERYDHDEQRFTRRPLRGGYYEQSDGQLGTVLIFEGLNYFGMYVFRHDQEMLIGYLIPHDVACLNVPVDCDGVGVAAVRSVLRRTTFMPSLTAQYAQSYAQKGRWRMLLHDYN